MKEAYRRLSKCPPTWLYIKIAIVFHIIEEYIYLPVRPSLTNTNVIKVRNVLGLLYLAAP
jgi:hypothetical protein